MSSLNVRTKVKNFITTNAPTEKLIDLTARFEEIKELIEDEGLVHDSPWLGIEFIAGDEIPITVPATNTQGKYRETGALYFHVVGLAVLGSVDTILARGEALRNLLRGQRIDDIIIESVTPLNFDAGATLRFQGGYISASFLASYESDTDL